MPQLTPDEITRLRTKINSLNASIADFKAQNPAPGVAKDAVDGAIRVREKQVKEIEALLKVTEK